MLSELAIRNFAIIDDLRIQFEDGMTVMSGETGAGKSIIIQAVNLLLGGRAASRMIRTGCDTAEVEALFHPPRQSAPARRMEALGLRVEDGLLVRRIIARNGNHRTYIAGRLATVQELATLTDQLATISGQHAHQRLLDEAFHLEILDRHAGLDPLRMKVAEQVEAIETVLSERNRLIREQGRLEAEAELIAFQKKEIEEADLKENEDALLEAERNKLRHAETLMQDLSTAIGMLYAAEGAITEQLATIGKHIEKASRLDGTLSESRDAASALSIQCEDLAENLRQYVAALEIDPTRLDDIEARLHLISRLKKKYGGSLPAISDHLEDLHRQSRDLGDIPERIDALEADLDQKAEGLRRTARTLSEKREQAASRLGKSVERELADLKMKGTRFFVKLSPNPAGSSPPCWLLDGNARILPTGSEGAAFLIAPNVGETEKPLAKIASGGELSRVVLSVKSILAKSDSVGLVVFDEADAGIGGSVAEAVGRKMALLSRFHQVVCITHLPQIAKFGIHHHRIEKRVRKGRTHTVIYPLDTEGRTRELARMLGGEVISDTTLEHARELLEDGSHP